MFLEILVEGFSDVPTVREILGRKFGLKENEHFRIHPHRGKGRLPENPHARPDPRRRGLLDQLPAKLRGYGNSLGHGYGVVVLIDADEEDCRSLKRDLVDLHNSIIPSPPHVLFRIAVEETESWFLADRDAVKAGVPDARMNKIPDVPADSVIGAWERLAEVFKRDPKDCSGADKVEWAEAIAPKLDLEAPRSPSLGAFIRGIQNMINRTI